MTFSSVTGKITVKLGFEDCENCDMKNDCPHPKKFGREGKFLKEMHELFVDNEIDSTLHPMTSKVNVDMGKTCM